MWTLNRAVVRNVIVVFLMSSVAWVAAMQPPTAEPKGATIVTDLQAAYDGESNAAAKYAAFAKKADEEGYGPVASLFRAAAKAEEIHAKNHAEVLKKLGAEPKATIKPAEIKTTKLNLEAAVAGESYERDTMYPEFLTRAVKEKNKEAIRTFNFAMAAESEHAKLYTEALSKLAEWKTSAKKDFFVCAICGNTTVKIDFEKCPSCFTHKDEYIKVT